MAVEPRQLYHGTKTDLKPGDLIDPDPLGFVHVADTLDAAAWQGETAPGDGPGRIYVVVATGSIMDAPDSIQGIPPRLAPRFRSEAPVRVVDEVTDSDGRPQRLYHGTKADLAPGDLIESGRPANFGEEGRVANHVYMAGTLDAAIWGAELSRGNGRERIYLVEPTGPIMDDPNVTNARFRGNPTKSYRSRDPLRVTGEVTDWQGHPPEVLRAMRESLEQSTATGTGVIDD